MNLRQPYIFGGNYRPTGMWLLIYQLFVVKKCGRLIQIAPVWTGLFLVITVQKHAVAYHVTVSVSIRFPSLYNLQTYIAYLPRQFALLFAKNMLHQLIDGPACSFIPSKLLQSSAVIFGLHVKMLRQKKVLSPRQKLTIPTVFDRKLNL